MSFDYPRFKLIKYPPAPDMNFLRSYYGTFEDSFNEMTAKLER